MASFPNPATQFRGGERLGKPRPKIGKRRAISMRSAMLTDEALNGTPPPFEGDSIDYLRAVMLGTIAPDPTRLAAAMALARFDRPALSATAVTVTKPDEQLNPEQRRERIGVLAEKLGLVSPVPPEPALIEGPPPVDLDVLERRAAMERENARLRAQIAEIEALKRDMAALEAAQVARAREAGGNGGFSLTFDAPALARAPQQVNPWAMHDRDWQAAEAAREARERQPTCYDPLSRAIAKLR